MTGVKLHSVLALSLRQFLLGNTSGSQLREALLKDPGAQEVVRDFGLFLQVVAHDSGDLTESLSERLDRLLVE